MKEKEKVNKVKSNTYKIQMIKNLGVDLSSLSTGALMCLANSFTKEAQAEQDAEIASMKAAIVNYFNSVVAAYTKIKIELGKRMSREYIKSLVLNHKSKTMRKTA